MHRHWKDVRLVGWAHEVPDERVTSEALEERLRPLFSRAGVAPGALAERTGVFARRWAPAEAEPEDVAAAVATRAVKHAGVSARRLDLVLNASIDHRYFEPSGAHWVAQALGTGHGAQVFDVRNACLGFLDAISIAADRIEQGAAHLAVVVAAEAGGTRRAADSAIARALEAGVVTSDLWMPLTVGCGAVAWVLGSARQFPRAASIDGFVTRNAVRHRALCVGRIEDDGRLTLDADGLGILRRGVALVVETFREASSTLGASLEQAFGHQVGLVHSRAVEQRLGFRFDERALLFRELGNTGPVGLPFAVARAADDGWLKDGPVTMLGAGSGLSAAVMAMTWRAR